MTKEMLFLAEIYTNWCKSQGLPDYMSADDLRYGRDTTDKLNFYQMNWLECFIDVWDCINQNTQEVIMQTEKRYYVTTKFEKYGTYTIMARSKEHAIQMWKDGDWNFDDYESDYGEYNEVIDEVEEEVFADTQLSLEGVMQPVKCNPIEYREK